MGPGERYAENESARDGRAKEFMFGDPREGTRQRDSARGDNQSYDSSMTGSSVSDSILPDSATDWPANSMLRLIFCLPIQTTHT